MVEYEPDGTGSFRIPEITHLWDRAILGPQPLTLAGVRSVSVSPMTGGLDKYLAEQLRAAGIFTVVSDGQQADAIWTEGAGTIELVAAGAGYPLWSGALPKSAKTARRRAARAAVAEVKKQAQAH